MTHRRLRTGDIVHNSYYGLFVVLRSFDGTTIAWLVPKGGMTIVEEERLVPGETIL